MVEATIQVTSEEPISPLASVEFPGLDGLTVKAKPGDTITTPVVVKDSNGAVVPTADLEFTVTVEGVVAAEITNGVLVMNITGVGVGSITTSVGRLGAEGTPVTSQAPDTPTIYGWSTTETTWDLTSSAFSDPDAGDTHLNSDWQVTTAADTGFASVVFESLADASNKTSIQATGLTGETDYIARVLHRDGQGNPSSYSSTVADTTTAGGYSLYPNKPSGMEEVFQWDGTTAYYGTSWYHSPSWVANVSSIVDATNPLGTGYSLKMNFLSGLQGAGIAADNHFDGGNYSELYFMYRVFYPSDWELLGQKNFYFGTHLDNRNEGSPTDYYITAQWPNAYTATLTSQHSGTGGNFMDEAGVWSRGVWHEVELHVVAESTPAASDGEFYYWMDGVLIDSSTSIAWITGADTSVGFNGCEWYCVRNDYNTYDTYFKCGEFYCAGK